MRRPTRSEVPIEQTWELSGLFATTAEWEADLQKLEAMLPRLSAYSGRLGGGASELLACLRLRDQVNEVVYRLVWFAQNRFSEDQGDPERIALVDRTMRAESTVQAAQAFIKPELLSLPEGSLEAYLAGEPALGLYKHHLGEILAQKEHMLDRSGEMVLAEVAPLLQAPFEIWQQTTNVDLTFAPIANEQGEQVPMSLAGWVNFSQSPVRRVRQAADESFRSAYAAHSRTIAAAVAAATRRDVILARLRKYPSALAAALAREQMPEAVFHNLLRVCEGGTVHYRRHLAWKRKHLGLDHLMPWDLRAPLDSSQADPISFVAAFRLIQEALAPLGPEYAAVLKRAFDERWVDWADNEGKGGNAYSAGCYSYHPVVKIQWQGTLYDLFTLAHELGHAAHSWFTSQTQPFVYAEYTTSLAETASTTNEILVARHLLQRSGDPGFRRAVLNMALTSFHDNFFYAGVLASLQREMHQAVEEGNALTCESITAMNTELLRRWYGDVVPVTPEGLGSQWNWVLHHFLDFYGYQYTLGISAAAAFADAILTEGGPAVERYLGFLRAGSSAPTLEILRAAGLDLTTPAPIERAVSVYAALVDELER